jgi:hypothetical protein
MTMMMVHRCSITQCAFEGKRVQFTFTFSSTADRTIMSSNNANDRKRKPTNIVPDTVPSNDGRNPKERKARKVSTNAASLMAEPPPLVIENAAAASAVSTANEDEESIQSTAAEHEESIENVGKMIQDQCQSRRCSRRAVA